MSKNCLEELKAANGALLVADLLAKELLIKNDALRADAERDEQAIKKSQEKMIAPLLKQVEEMEKEQLEMKKEQLQFKARAERAEGKLERLLQAEKAMVEQLQIENMTLRADADKIMEVTRAEHEKLIAPLVKQVKEALDEVLRLREAARMTTASRRKRTKRGRRRKSKGKKRRTRR